MSHEALGGPPTGDGKSEWTVVGPIPGGGEGDSCQPARRPNSRRIADPRGPREEHCAPCRPPEERGAGSREARNMAGRPAAPASPPADRDGAAPNVVARISQWADDHLRLVRVPQPRWPGRWWAQGRVGPGEASGSGSRRHLEGRRAAGSGGHSNRGAGEAARGARPGWARSAGRVGAAGRGHQRCLITYRQDCAGPWAPASATQPGSGGRRGH